MTEDEARAYIAALDVPRETVERLEAFAAALADEQQRQNLVSSATLDALWARHVADSAQLLRFVARDDWARRHWLDVGSGAGLPGLVLAAITGAPTTLVEPRPLRADFLARMVQRLDLPRCRVEAAPLARVAPFAAGVITARAVASLDKLIAMAVPFADLSTIWILPRGRSGRLELASLPRAWHDRWHAEASITSGESVILIGERMAPSGRAQ